VLTPLTGAHRQAPTGARSPGSKSVSRRPTAWPASHSIQLKRGAEQITRGWCSPAPNPPLLSGLASRAPSWSPRYPAPVRHTAHRPCTMQPWAGGVRQGQLEGERRRALVLPMQKAKALQSPGGPPARLPTTPAHGKPRTRTLSWPASVVSLMGMNTGVVFGRRCEWLVVSWKVGSQTP
jgi:hypothetical protein